MITKIRHLATEIGLGAGVCYAFFSITTVQELFSPVFIIMTKQALSLIFAVCLFISPKSLVNIGQQFSPKVIAFFKIFFTSDKQDQDEKN